MTAIIETGGYLIILNDAGTKNRMKTFYTVFSSESQHAILVIIRNP